MYLFDMTESQLDRAVQAHYDRLLDEYESDNGQCCKYCTHYNRPYCERYVDDEDDVPFETMERDDDDWCEEFDPEDYEP